MARPSLFERVRDLKHWLPHSLAVLSLSFLLATPAWSQSADHRYLAEIELHSEAELVEVLQRTRQLAEAGQLRPGSGHPVRFVLHGPEVTILLVENYPQHSATVDLARDLSGRGLVDIKVCETWMGREHISAEQLPPFVGTVPYAPTEIQRLLDEEQYVYF